MNMHPRIETLSAKMLIGHNNKMSLADNKTGQLWGGFALRIKEVQDRVSSDKISMQLYPPNWPLTFRCDLCGLSGLPPYHNTADVQDHQWGTQLCVNVDGDSSPSCGFVGRQKSLREPAVALYSWSIPIPFPPAASLR